MNEKVTYEEAAERVKNLKSLYIHVALYVVVCSVLFAVNQHFSPDHQWYVWPAGGWGVGVVIHAISHFMANNNSLSKWEEKKIQQYMKG